MKASAEWWYTLRRFLSTLKLLIASIPAVSEKISMQEHENEKHQTTRDVDAVVSSITDADDRINTFNLHLQYSADVLMQSDLQLQSNTFYYRSRIQQCWWGLDWQPSDFYSYTLFTKPSQPQTTVIIKKNLSLHHQNFTSILIKVYNIFIWYKRRPQALSFRLPG